MLFSLGHGQHVAEGKAARDPDLPSSVQKPMSAVCPHMASAYQSAPALQTANGGETGMISTAEIGSETGRFGYLFADADPLPEDPDIGAKLDALAATMVEAQGDPGENNSAIPPVFTYFGQFIDHDITANTDRSAGMSRLDGPLNPIGRADVEKGIGNLRDGSLGLDSLYGDTLGQGSFATRLAQLMRFPGNGAKMRLARCAPIGDPIPIPSMLDQSDRATDLLRLGFLIDNNLITVDELQDLDSDTRGIYLDTDGNPIRSRAIIGDNRNDENLLVAQMQVMFLRFHNKLADATGGRSFDKARRLTRWHYQWLVVNQYLPTVCDPDIVKEVIDLEAPLYSGFFDKYATYGPKLPMPLEFSVAGFRFGHSMIRGAYDHNRAFGTAVEGFEHNIDISPFDLLFAFTGDGGMPAALPTDPANTSGQLPQRWVIEWDRFVKTDPAHPQRAARKIDTIIAPPLAELSNAANDISDADLKALFKHLARRNLRRGYLLSLPTAQACIAAIGCSGFKDFRVLTAEELRSGSDERRQAVEDGGFDVATPLWFYILKEAEVIGGGEHLGPLGSHIVANTLIGLIVHDPESYWNADMGQWSPSQFRKDDPIDCLEKVARFTGMID